MQTLLQEYIWFDGVPVAVVDGQTDAVFFVRTDHIGRPVFATDDTGAKVWEASYLPFGGVHVSTGAAIDLRFPGQWFHAENGLHQNWMRDYDPTTGRYIQADPLGLVDGASVYGYALQSPGRYVDPEGLKGQRPNRNTSSRFGSGFASFYNGLFSCVTGGCRDRRIGEAAKFFWSQVTTNPELRECLMELLENLAKQKGIREFSAGRVAGGVIANFGFSLTSKRLPRFRRTTNLSVGATLFLGSAAGNLSSLITSSGNPSLSEFAQILSFGEVLLPGIHCEQCND